MEDSKKSKEKEIQLRRQAGPGTQYQIYHHRTHAGK